MLNRQLDPSEVVTPRPSRFLRGGKKCKLSQHATLMCSRLLSLLPFSWRFLRLAANQKTDDNL